MKRWMIGLAILVMLTSIACEAQDNVGLILKGNLSCEEEEVPAIGGSASMQAGGRYDLLLADFYGPGTGYNMTLWFYNNRESNYDEDLSRGEGNQIRVKGVEVEYEALGYTIEKQFIAAEYFISPQGSVAISVNVFPAVVKDAINAHYAQDAYADVQNGRSYFQIGANNALASCTTDNAEQVCMGYACNAGDSGSGTCMPFCTIQEGCAGEWEIGGGRWKCDVGTGPYGYCRPSCKDTGYCNPVMDASNNVVLEYDCVEGMCVPKGTNVNPMVPEIIILKIRIAAEGSNGDDFKSNEITYPIEICRNCLINYSSAACGMEITDINEALNDMGDECGYGYLSQDRYVQCGWVGGCASWFCAK